jgi:hypothetical protein
MMMFLQKSASAVGLTPINVPPVAGTFPFTHTAVGSAPALIVPILLETLELMTIDGVARIVAGKYAAIPYVLPKA